MFDPKEKSALVLTHKKILKPQLFGLGFGLNRVWYKSWAPKGHQIALLVCFVGWVWDRGWRDKLRPHEEHD